MAINEAEILRQLEKENLGVNPEKVYTNIITELADEIVDNYRDVIEDNTRSDNGALKSSVVAIPSKNGFEIEADYYFKFIDEGVRGVGQFGEGSRRLRPLVQNSPYSFKHLGVPRSMASSIREWSGASMPQAYAIAVNIKNYGIKPKNISNQAITDQVLERISSDLATVTGLVVEVLFDKTLGEAADNT